MTETAADELVARYGDTLLYIHGFLGDLHEAEDLMIEAFALMFAKPRPVHRIDRKIAVLAQRPSECAGEE